MNTLSEISTKIPLQKLAARLSDQAVADGRSSTGELARLRRMNPREPEGALGVLYAVLGERYLNGSIQQLQRWTLIVHCLALARGRHREDAPAFGRVLHDLNFGELRLQQVLRADLELLFDLLPRVARRLAAQSAEANWWPVVTLVLNADTASDRSGYGRDAERAEKADAARLRIAKDFVLAEGADDAKKS